MRILLINFGLGKGSGTVRYLMDLAFAMRRRGHECVIYAPVDLGECAEALRSEGFLVEDDLSKIPEPDVIHAQQTYPALEAIQVFDRAPLLFIAHDPFWHMGQVLPQSIVDAYAAVDAVTEERVVSDSGCNPSAVNRLPNGVDLTKFAVGSRLRKTPEKALIYSGSYQTTEHFDAIRKACRTVGLTLDEAISAEKSYFTNPEEQLGDYDIVFAKARCAMEAMVSGAFVIIIGDKGIGPPITLDVLEDLRLKNFGYECLEKIEDLEGELLRRIASFDSVLAGSVSKWAYANLDAEQTWNRFDALYRRIAAKPAIRLKLKNRNQYVCRLLLRYSKTDPRLLPNEVRKRKEAEKARRIAERVAQRQLARATQCEESRTAAPSVAGKIKGRTSVKKSKTFWERCRLEMKRFYKRTIGILSISVILSGNLVDLNYVENYISLWCP